MDNKGSHPNKSRIDSSIMESSSTERIRHNIKATVHPKRGDSQRWVSNESLPISENKENEGNYY